MCLWEKALVKLWEKRKKMNKIINVQDKIKEDFNNASKEDLEKLFDNFETNKRNSSFVKYYNRTVLDKEKINFGEFKHQWAIQGMTREVYGFFDENFDMLKEEIISKKDIKEFYNKYCITKRREGSFCSKLFHTLLPNEFPPVDNPIRNYFGFHNEELINSVMLIQKGYRLFIKENPYTLGEVRDLFSKEKFSYLRAKELSDIRIIDMFYWLKESRLK